MEDKKKEYKKEAIKTWTEPDSNIPSDVLGSYTGTPTLNALSDEYEMPVQDADDI